MYWSKLKSVEPDMIVIPYDLKPTVITKAYLCVENLFIFIGAMQKMWQCPVEFVIG